MIDFTRDSTLIRSRFDRTNLFQNGGWCYDNYPDLKPLDAGTSVEIANLEGPGVVKQIHITQHVMKRGDSELIRDESVPGGDIDHDRFLELQKSNRRVTARGVVIEIYYDGARMPSVRCPLADFFADGCNGHSTYYSTPFVEKLPESYNCYIPMPFASQVRVVLENETAFDLISYSFVEAETLPKWEADLLYFHATWAQTMFQLSPETETQVISLDKPGHLIGSQFSIVTDEPLFRNFNFVMEGNCEHRIDGEAVPTIDYLGTEDSFGFSWGFGTCFCGLHSGINHLQVQDLPHELSIYRFRPHNPIIFKKSLDMTINWKHEYTNGKRDYHSPVRVRLQECADNGGCWVQLSSTYYWYQPELGHDHLSMVGPAERSGFQPPLTDRGGT